MEIPDEPDTPGLMEDDPMLPVEVRGQEDMSNPEDKQWSPACTHMATSNNDDEQLASGAHTHIHTDDHTVISMHT